MREVVVFSFLAKKDGERMKENGFMVRVVVV